jgi:hypothetical protein
MAKVTITCLLISTLMLLVTFGKGMNVLHGGDVGSHLSWALATLVSVLAANVLAMFHAAQSDRIIRNLRAHNLRARLEPDEGAQTAPEGAEAPTGGLKHP